MACHSWSRGPPETECPRGRGREAGNNGIAQLQPAGLQENQPAFSIPPSTWQGPILCQLRSQLVRACACVCVCVRVCETWKCVCVVSSPGETAPRQKSRRQRAAGRRAVYLLCCFINQGGENSSLTIKTAPPRKHTYKYFMPSLEREAASGMRNSSC